MECNLRHRYRCLHHIPCAGTEHGMQLPPPLYIHATQLRPPAQVTKVSYIQTPVHKMQLHVCRETGAWNTTPSCPSAKKLPIHTQRNCDMSCVHTRTCRLNAMQTAAVHAISRPLTETLVHAVQPPTVQEMQCSLPVVGNLRLIRLRATRHFADVDCRLLAAAPYTRRYQRT